MIKKRFLGLFILSTILLLPFSSSINVAGAPIPSYIGVTEGQEIIWEINFDKANIDTAVTDVSDALNEVYDYLGAEPDGLEDFIEQWIPEECLDLNLSSAIFEWIYHINDTVHDLFPGLFSEDFMDTINMTELITTFLNNVTGEIIPNTSDLSIADFIDFILDNYIPTGLFEDGWREILNATTVIDELLANITAQLNIESWLNFNVSTFILNVLDILTVGFMPAGWFDMNASTLIDELIDVSLVTQEMVDTLNISQLIGKVMETFLNDTLPAGWRDLNITDMFEAIIADIDGSDFGLLGIILELYPFVMNSFLSQVDPETSQFLNNTMQELFDYFQAFLDDAFYNASLYYSGYGSSGNIIDSITGDYSFSKWNPSPNSGNFSSGTVTFDSPYNTFTILDVEFDSPSQDYWEITLDGTGFSQNLTELGYTTASTASMSLTFVTQSPDMGLTVGEIIASRLEFFGNIPLLGQQITSPSSNLQIIDMIDGDTFVVGDDPSYDSWKGGVVGIHDYFNGNNGYFLVTDVIHTATNNTIDIETQSQTLTEMGFGVGNFTTFHELGYFQYNLTSMSIQEIIDMLLNMTYLPFLDPSLSITETIEGALLALNSTLDLMGLSPDFLSLPFNEAVEVIKQLLDIISGQAILIPLTTGMVVQSLDYPNNFTVAPNAANATWINKTAIVSGFRIPITSVIDNGTNVIISTPYDLSMYPFISPGSSVYIYRPFDFFNDTIHSILTMIPALNFTVSEILDSWTQNPSFRDFIQNCVLMLNETMATAGIGIDLASDSIHQIIQGCIEIVNNSVAPIINFLNDFMENDTSGYPYYMNMLQSAGYLSNTLGLKFVINSIGDEIELYSGGPRGVPIDASIYFSPDMINWVLIDFISQTVGGNNIFICDPSSMPGGTSDVFELLLPMNISSLLPGMDITPLGILNVIFPMASGLFMATTNDWTILNQEITIPAEGINLPGMTLSNDLKELYCSIGWTTDGILEKSEVKYGGNLAASINLQTADPTPESEIPGFEIMIILGITASASIGLIYVVMKKKRTL